MDSVRETLFLCRVRPWLHFGAVQACTIQMLSRVTVVKTRHVEHSEIFREVGTGENLDAVVARLHPALAKAVEPSETAGQPKRAADLQFRLRNGVGCCLPNDRI